MHSEKPMNLLILLCCCMVVTVVHSQQTCNNLQAPWDKCSCQHGGTITCKNFTSLPTTGPPEGYTTIEFINCNFPNLTKVDFTTATQLFMMNCKIQNIANGTFKTMTNLQTLDLSSNSISKLYKPVFEGLGNLKSLSVQMNNLQNVDTHTFCPSNLKSLESLSLQGNQITSFPANMMVSKKLTYLNIGDNKFTVVPHAVWSRIKGLQVLHLHGNQLSFLKDESFEDLPNLKTLNADKCGIEDISDYAFSQQSNLEELFLGNNKLTKLEAHVFESCIHSLKKLHLQNNSFTTLDGAIGEKLMHLEDVRLEGNPWTCNCEINWLSKYKSSKPDEQPKCTKPEDKKGQLVANVTSTMECSGCYGSHCGGSNRGVVALAVGIPILVICAALIAFFLWNIAKARKEEDKRKSVRYSAVYRDTVESNNKRPLVA